MSVSKEKSEKIINQILKDINKIKNISDDLSSTALSAVADRAWTFELKGKVFKLEKTSSILRSFAPAFKLKLLGPRDPMHILAAASSLGSHHTSNDILIYPHRTEGLHAFDIGGNSAYENKLSILMNHLIKLDDKKTEEMLGDSFFD